MIYKTLHRILKIKSNWGWTRVFRKERQFLLHRCCQVNLHANPMISHEWDKDRIEITTDGTCPWTYASQFVLRVYQTRQFPTKEMIAIFSLWTFHLYVTTFQHQLHVKFIRYYRVCGSYHDVLDLGCYGMKGSSCYTGAVKLPFMLTRW
jgi:hypothetical protein